MLTGLDELSVIIFNGTAENSIPTAVSKNQTIIIYGTAIEDSVDGEVLIKLDDAIYAADDIDNDEQYQYVILSEEDDDINAIDEDEQLEDPEDEDEEIVFWDESEEDAVDYDEQEQEE